MSKPPKFFDKTLKKVLSHVDVDNQNFTGQKGKVCLLYYTIDDVKTIVEKGKKY